MIKRLIVTLALMLSQVVSAATERDIVEHYAAIAHAVYGDSAAAAAQLLNSVDALLSKPDENTLAGARSAWKAARVPYQQSEVFRFGNLVVDDWEGRVNSWPLDEGLIDYVDDSYAASLGNIAADMNIIANPRIDLGGAVIDAAQISPALLEDLHEVGGAVANVTTGYHAIEFLLWGQDLNGHQAGAGQRPYTDFVVGEACSHGHCERRAAYLRAATQQLVSDLRYMASQWAPGNTANYRAELLSLPPKQALARIVKGMGSLSLGELGGERIKVALEANSPEDEHDCFSDNTHWSHYYNGLGIRNVYLGEYQRRDGTLLRGPSLSAAVAAVAPRVDKQLRLDLDATMAELKTLTEWAERPAAPQKFDMLIAPDHPEGRALLTRILQRLEQQTRSIEQAASAINVNANAS